MSTSKLARLFSELVGTFALTAVVIAVTKNYGNPLFATISAAAAYAVLTSLFGHVSGAQFNPALTLGMFSMRKIKLVETVLFVAMQAVGAVLAWKLFEFLSPDRLITSVANEFDWKVLVAELVGAAVFGMGYAAVLYRKFTGGHAGATVGLALFVGSVASAVVIINRELVTGILNPAVAIGVGYRPDSQSYLAYFFGPVIGAVVGMNLYRMFFSKDVEVKAASSVRASTVASVSAKKPAAKKATAKKTTRRTTAKKK